MENLYVDRPRRRHLPALALVIAAMVVSSLLTPSQAATPPFGPGSAEGVVKSGRIGGDFFGIDISIGPEGAATWPEFNPGVVRISQPWSQIERTPGTYDWAHLDVKIATAEQHQAKPLIVLEGTPTFHARGSGATSASPPRLPAFRRFVRALVARYGERADYQVWNEANVVNFFTGTPAHMAAMTKIVGRAVHKAAPEATVVGPSFPLRGEHPDFRTWFRAYWKQTVGKRHRPVADFVDVAAISAYPMPNEDPEDALALTQWARKIVARRGFKGPLWAVEINYGASGLEPTTAPRRMKVQVAYVVRTYVLHATAGADRVYWWRWEEHQTVNTSLNNGTGGLTRAGKAYGVVEDWLTGTRPKGCTTSKGVTACRFSVGKGVQRYVYWTRSGKTRKVSYPAGAETKTLAGRKTTSVERTKRLRVGLKPVMVETRKK